jgi:hypothetical protein
MDRLPVVKKFNRPRQEKLSKIRQNSSPDLRLQHFIWRGGRYGSFHRSAPFPGPQGKSVGWSADRFQVGLEYGPAGVIRATGKIARLRIL